MVNTVGDVCIEHAYIVMVMRCIQIVTCAVYCCETVLNRCAYRFMIADRFMIEAVAVYKTLPAVTSAPNEGSYVCACRLEECLFFWHRYVLRYEQ